MSKTRKNNKKSYKRTLIKKHKGGNCRVCGNKMNGGYGNSNLNEVPLTKYYPLNNYANDPNNNTIMQSGRLTSIQQNGGKQLRKSRKTRKNQKSKKMRGGIGGFLLGNSSNVNPVLNVGTVGGSFSSNSILSGTQNVNTAPYSQPNYNTNVLV